MASNNEFLVEMSDEYIKTHFSTRKDLLVRFLKRNFKEGRDFTYSKSHRTYPEILRGGRNKINYMLTQSTSELLKSSYNIKNKYVSCIGNIDIKAIVMSVESSTIGFICNALAPLFEMTRQYRVGKYKVDLYIKDINLCVECDEFGHIHYKNEKEIERERFICERLKCTVLRFNPNEKNFDISNVIANILKLYNEYITSKQMSNSIIH